MTLFDSSTQVRHLHLKVWLSVFIYAMLAGLAVQLVILPHVFPQLHAGNGLLAGRDWVGFHEQAVVQSLKIAEFGWSEFRLRPDGDNAIIGVTSWFYVLFGPHPWSLLPLSALTFACGGMALFCILKHLELDDNEAIIALLPYLLFPSALLQFAQIHKDVFCTAGVLVVLSTWVGLLRKGRKVREIFPLMAANTIALLTISVFRPYFMLPFLALCVLLLLWHVGKYVWQFSRPQVAHSLGSLRVALRFNLESIAILAILNVILYGFSISYLDIRLSRFPDNNIHSLFFTPSISFISNKDVRSPDSVRILNASTDEAKIIKGIEECRPVMILKDNAFYENMANRVFIKIAVARAGFTSSGGSTAASNIDKGLDFCKNEDLIRYIPRAMQIALFAPFPSNWLAVEKRNSSPIEIYISAVEMFYCYIAFFGLAYWLISYRRWTVALVIPIALALGILMLLGLTVANVGTLYRMRFPFLMILICFGMAGVIQFTKIKPRWVNNLD